MSSSESQPKRQQLRKFAAASIAAGAVVLALSYLPALSSGKERWTTEKARAYQKSSLEIQTLTHKLVSTSPDEMSREASNQYRAAMDNYEALRGELEAARSRPMTLAAILRVLSLALILAGAVAGLSTVRRERVDRQFKKDVNEAVDKVAAV